MQALMAGGLVAVISIRNRMIKERVLTAKNRSSEIRKIALQLELSERVVRQYAYRYECHVRFHRYTTIAKIRRKYKGGYP